MLWLAPLPILCWRERGLDGGCWDDEDDDDDDADDDDDEECEFDVRFILAKWSLMGAPGFENGAEGNPCLAAAAPVKGVLLLSDFSLLVC